MTTVTRVDPAAGAAMEKTGISSQLLHDLRSPLNQIIGYSEILSEDAGTELRPTFTTDLEKIRAAGLRLLSLIEESFTAAGGETHTTEMADDDEPALSLSRQPAVAPGLLLVVDDDATNRDVLSRRLKRQGHTVHTASSGRDALEAIGKADFDLVLLDIMMPDMDGYEVLGRIKADDRLHHIPVIMISALSEVRSVVRCIEAGAEDYLTKPFNPTLLKARIGACLGKKRGQDRETELFEQLQANYKELQAAEKLRDDLRNMIVHDLRTPLTSVIVGVEMLEKHGTLTEEQRSMMTIASRGGSTLLAMINDLLDVEKMESGSFPLSYAELSAGTLVAGAMQQVASLAQDAETVLVAVVHPDLPLFPGDENKLSRTLVNLIGNAIKFTQRGTVTITASLHDGATIRFAVRDTGHGIPAEAFERIFEKFGQVDSHSKVGTGLGLTFCKLAVEAHGGHIFVESAPDTGSTFSFTIPLTHAHS